MQPEGSQDKEPFNTVECFVIEKQHNLIQSDKKGIAQKKIDIGGKIIDFASATVTCKANPNTKYNLVRSTDNMKRRVPGV